LLLKRTKDYNHYNDRVDAATAERLIDLNRRFYEERGRDFSETRLRLQPGVKRILDSLRGDESILDLGCGNGQLARELSRRGHHGSYLGLDFSLPLLNEARRDPFSFAVRFEQADLTALRMDSRHALAVRESSGTTVESSPGAEGWRVITAFAVLHHIPSRERRLELLARVHHWLQPAGVFIHSNWQFLRSARLLARIQPWDAIGLTQRAVDINDYLLDWRRGGLGLRYVHQFEPTELAELARTCDFEVVRSFYSDGADRKSGLYQVWRRV
jgi:tRNA (uracil-5-)-methyltransferase TRM9